MTDRWLTLLLGVALLQGSLSFGPIDETDEDLIESRNLMTETTGYRLPTTIFPTHYVVHLTPHLGDGENQFTFDGVVTINVVPTQVVNQIVLHCNNLTIDATTVRVTPATIPYFNMATPSQVFTCNPRFSAFAINTYINMAVGQTYTISMSFRGFLQTNMRGFYRSWYTDVSGVRRWMATTQFQPSHARQAFPCFDEPRFKATFDISITRDVEGFSETISNMPLRQRHTAVNGKIREDFHTTPPTSTYLLAFIVSDYRQVASNNNDYRPFHIYARNNIGNTGSYSLAVGVPLLQVMEDYTQYNYYQLSHGSNTYQMNMKQAAIPDFSAGAMGNWGLLTYREALILYDPENTNNFYKQRIANIVSHQIANMWFGNLVTCAWWDNLWLNEGFARFYQYFLTEKIEPEMGFENRFITEQVHVSLLADAATTAHPLTDPSVLNSTTVSDHFSTITYAKGAAVLRMTQHLLGNDTYVTGLREYLKNNAFGVAEPSTLFNALQAATVGTTFATDYPGVTIFDYFTSWSLKAGHPQLNITINHDTGIMSLKQFRFYRDAGVSANPEVLWDIPITWTRGGNPDFCDLKPTQIMRTAEISINRGSIGLEWVIFNKQQTGFYRVNYDEVTWDLITQALRGNDRELIHEYNRAQIVDDVFLLARSGQMTYRRALNILSFLRFEDKYAPWLAAITGFNFALRRLAHGSVALIKLRSEIIDLSTAVVNRLGFNEKENAGNFMDDLFRMHISTFLCNVGHQGCIDTAKRSFQQWTNGGRIPPNMRPWVYCNGLRYGSGEDYDFFWNRYLNTDLANEQVVMLTAAGCTQDQPSLNRFLANIAPGTVENFVVRVQDYSTAISAAVTGNEYNTIWVFHWLQANFRQANATGIVNNMISLIASRLLTEADITLIESWVSANQNNLGQVAYATAISGLETSRNNIQFYTQRVSEFKDYFNVGYENIFPDTAPPGLTTVPTTSEATTPMTSTTTTTITTMTTPTTTTRATEAPTTGTYYTTSTVAPATVATTPAPDSASIASLSIVTLTVTLIINMA